MKLRLLGCALTVGLAASVTTAATAHAAPHTNPSLAAATAADTATYRTTAIVNVRSGPGTGFSVVGQAAKGTQLVGIVSGSWLKITLGTNAGRYVSAAWISKVTSPWKLWVATNHLAVRTGPGTKYSTVGYLNANVPVNGIPSGDWVNILTGPYAGRWMWGSYITTSPPGTGTPGSVATPSPYVAGTTVTRYVVATNYYVRIHYNPFINSIPVARLATGTALVGQYTSRDWFKVTSGTYAGLSISSAVLQTSPDGKAVNGKVAASTLCPVPSSFSTIWEPTTTRYLNCAGLTQLIALNTAFRAQFGYNLTIDEGFRDLTKQNYFFTLWNYPRAAYPGTSNHGYGTAIDLDANPGSPYTWGTPADLWLHDNAQKFGWERPSYYNSPGGSSEYWHYNFIG